MEFRNRTYRFDHNSWIKVSTPKERVMARKRYEYLTPQRKPNSCLHIQTKEYMDDNGDIHDVCIKCNRRDDWLPEALA